MFEKLRKYFETPVGRGIGIGFSVLVILVAIFFIKSTLTDETHKLGSTQMFVDVTTQKPFAHEIQAGESIPVTAPSGGKTGYPAEACTWTKDGGIKTDPTYVVLNETMGKELPTFCPDCGRLVVGHNPAASTDRKPPITETEYKARGYTYRESRQ